MMTDPGKSLQVSVTGDVALGGPFIERARPGSAALHYPFEPLDEALRGTDLLLLNLEGPIGDTGSAREGRTALLHNEPDLLDWMEGFPCCVCTLANNHAMDYGAEALQRTLAMLASRGIHCVGAGADREEAGRALILELGGMSLAILSFTTDEVHVGSVIATADGPGSCALPPAELAVRRVGELAESCDVVIVIPHWGHEYHRYPTPAQTAWCRAVADAGASLVVGHHPHVQQGCETRGSSVICHSLGNLILPEMISPNGRLQYRKPATKQFAVLRAAIRRHAVGDWSLFGGRCDRGYRLVPYSGSRAERFDREIEALSKPLREPDYAGFWRDYSHRRRRQLRREGLRDAAAKILKSDLRTLRKTLSWQDVRRNLARLGAGRHREADS